jgi:hypothetical protein
MSLDAALDEFPKEIEDRPVRYLVTARWNRPTRKRFTTSFWQSRPRNGCLLNTG